MHARKITTTHDECPHMRAGCEGSIKCIDCVPEYVKNDHIVGGYRYNMSYWQASKSLFQLHNETINVWTHLLGIFGFLYLLFFFVLTVPTSHDRVVLLQEQFETIKQVHLPPFLRSSATLDSIAQLVHDSNGFAAAWRQFRTEYLANQQHAVQPLLDRLDLTLQELNKHLQAEEKSLGTAQIDPHLQSKLVDDFVLIQSELAALDLAMSSDLDAHYVPVWPLVVYIFSVISCFLFSTLFHLYCAVDGEDVHLLWRKMDYAGISILIAGSYIPVMYYLIELGSYRFFYIGCAFVIAAGVISFTLTDNAYKPEYRTFRACLYVAYGLFGLVPGLHTVYTVSHGHPSHPIVVNVFLRLSFMGFLYIFGAFLYVRRIPERWSTGKFDIFLHSHQFFHVLVILAALVHFQTCFDMWKLAHYHTITFIY